MAPNICGVASGFLRSCSASILHLSGVSFSFLYFFTLQEELEEYDVLDQADIGKFSQFCTTVLCGQFFVPRRHGHKTHRVSGTVERKFLKNLGLLLGRKFFKNRGVLLLFLCKTQF
jgi:hypothetical protein